MNDGRWTWIGLFGWSGKTIEDWDTARAAATARLGWAQPPLYGHTYEHSTAKFEGRVFDKMAIINYNRLKGGPDPCGYKAWARMGDYMRAVDAVIQATGHSDRERELDDEIRTFRLERRKRHIRAFVFTQELRQVGTPSLPSPVVSVVLDALDERLDGPGYQGDDRNWADRMGDWARTRGWTALSDDSVLRARFRAQLIEEIDAVFAVQAAPRWPPPELQLCRRRCATTQSSGRASSAGAVKASTTGIRLVRRRRSVRDGRSNLATRIRTGIGPRGSRSWCLTRWR